MKEKFVQIAAFCLALVLLLPASAAAAPSNLGDTIIRVGLFYGSSGLDGANLLNSVGSGYRLGYFDSSNQFVQLGAIGQRAISVVETQNVGYGSYNGYNSYHMALSGSAQVKVGCYHLELPGVYADFAQAQEAASACENGFPACIDGSFTVRVGSYLSKTAAEAARQSLGLANAAVVGTSAYGVSVVATGTGTILFQYDDLGAGTGLGVMPNMADDGGDYATVFKNTTWRGGFRYERVGGKNLTVVNMVRLDDYIKGVVPHEMSNGWPIEALKAQAVCARTYALRNRNRHSSYHFDVCCTTDCQVYSGLKRAGSSSDAAVDQTAGVVCTYNGQYAECVYYSSNGGASEGSATVWGGSQANYPYLAGVADPYEATVSIPGYSWTKSYTPAGLADVLNSKGYAVGSTVASAAVSAYTATGNPAGVTFTGSNGKRYTLTARTMVSVFGLRSYRYEVLDGSAAQGTAVSVNGGTTASASDLYAIDGGGNITAVDGDAYIITGSGVSQLPRESGGTSEGFTFSGKGWGHNVGMSQYGAYAMALQGYTYDQILKFYYTGITVG